jgi:predicted acyl esterase
VRPRVALALAVAVVASVLAGPAVPAPPVEWVAERAYVPTRHGEVFVDYVRPMTGKAPVLLAMAVDRADRTSGTTYYDAIKRRYAERGYAHAYADVLGTGWSGGCWDYGGRASTEAAAAVVEWLGTRPWSTGRVGMVGLWQTFEVAALAPRHLAAIVPQEAPTSWYHLNYEGGVLQASSDDEPAQTARPGALAPMPYDAYGAAPGADPAHPVAAAAGPCAVAEHAVRGYQRPAYDAFWRERDWASRAANIRAAVLAQHGWGDAEVKPDQLVRLLRGLRRSADVRVVIGNWDFADMYESSQPDSVVFPVDPFAYLDLFLARHLKGVRDPRLDQVPRVLTESSDRRFRTTLPLGPPGTTIPLGAPLPGGTGSFVNTGTETSKVFKADVTAQRGFAAYAHPVRRDTRLAGAGEAVLRLTTTLPRGQVVVTLLDLPPESDAATVVTLGLLDLRFRDSLTAPKDVPVGTPLTVRVPLRPNDYVLRQGHRLVVAVAGSDVVWGVPDSTVGQTVTVLPGSAVRLPLLSPAAGLV